MSDYTDRQSAALVKLEAATAILDSVANGTTQDWVETDSGNIPTLARFLFQLSNSALEAWSIYPDIATGVAATNDGDYFQIDAGDALALYRRDGTEATLINTFPTNGNVTTAIDVAYRPSTALTRPNLFDLDEVRCVGTPHFANPPGDDVPAVPDIYDGAPCFRLTVAPDAGTGLKSSWSFPAALFAETGTINASLRVLSVPAVSVASNAYLAIYQYDATNAAIGSPVKQKICDLSGIAVSRVISLDGVALAPTAAGVNVSLLLDRSPGEAHTMAFRDLMCSAGSSAFTLPEVGSMTSLWPDPHYIGVGASTFQGAPQMTEDGLVLSMSGAGTLQAIYSVGVGDRYRAGDVLTWRAYATCDAAKACDMTIFQYDAAGNQLSYRQVFNQVTDTSPLLCATQILATAALVSFRLVKRAAGTTASWRDIQLQCNRPDSRLVHVAAIPSRACIQVDAVTGNDAADGVSMPVRTFTRAMQLAGMDTLLMVSPGDYYDCPTITSAHRRLEVVASSGGRVRLIGGQKITGAVLMDGAARTYQVTAPHVPTGNWLYVHDVPEPGTLIDASERLPIHAGKQYRLPSTRIWPVATLAEIETDSRATWYYDASAQVLYFSVPDGIDPNAGVYYSNTLPSPALGATGYQQLRMSGIECWYWRWGVAAQSYAHVDLVDCRAVGTAEDGFFADDTGRLVMTRCEAAGCANDGCGGHTTDPMHSKGSIYVGYDCWYHDNWDDGESFHEGWTATDYGTVVEYNGDRGIVTALGGHSTHYNCLSRKNNQVPINGPGFTPNDGGQGFAAAGEADDGGVGTQMALYGCTADSNPINYQTHNGDDNALLAVGCMSIAPGTAHFQNSGGRMVLTDCRYQGAGVVMDGDVEVQSTAEVVA